MHSRLSSFESGRAVGQAKDLGGAGAPSDVDSLVGELDRIGGVVDALRAGLSDGVGEAEDLVGAVERARMFAHEVNNLVCSISGRAQRAMMSGDAAHRDEALRLASDLGARVGVLSELFMEWGSVGDEDSGYRPFGLFQSYLLDSHVFAKSIVASHWALAGERGGGIGFDVDVEEGAGVCVPGMLMGQVLVNLYHNALDGIARGWALGDADGGGTIRLGWRRIGEPDETGVVVTVEDSGVGFGSAEGRTMGGHGLGLGVCRGIVGGFGGRVEFGESAGLGGGMVSLIFDQAALRG